MTCVDRVRLIRKSMNGGHIFRNLNQGKRSTTTTGIPKGTKVPTGYSSY